MYNICAHVRSRSRAHKASSPSGRRRDSRKGKLSQNAAPPLVVGVAASELASISRNRYIDVHVYLRTPIGGWIKSIDRSHAIRLESLQPTKRTIPPTMNRSRDTLRFLRAYFYLPCALICPSVFTPLERASSSLSPKGRFATLLLPPLLRSFSRSFFFPPLSFFRRLYYSAGASRAFTLMYEVNRKARCVHTSPRSGSLSSDFLVHR